MYTLIIKATVQMAAKMRIDPVKTIEGLSEKEALTHAKAFCTLACLYFMNDRLATDAMSVTILYHKSEVVRFRYDRSTAQYDAFLNHLDFVNQL